MAAEEINPWRMRIPRNFQLIQAKNSQKSIVVFPNWLC